MTVTSELQAQIDMLRGEVGQLERSIAPAVAAGLRAHSDRPSIEKGAPTIQFGVVDSVFEDDGYANVILDGQTVVTPCMILGAVVEGERVAVIFYPPSGSLIIGMVDPNAQTAGVAISGLPVAATLTGGELVPVVQSGATVQTTAQDIADLAPGGGSSGFPIIDLGHGDATAQISIPIDSDPGGGPWAMAMQQSLISTNSPESQAFDLWFLENTPDGLGGFDESVQRVIKASLAADDTIVELLMSASLGATAIGAQTDWSCAGGNYLGFGGPTPIPHIQMRSGFTSTTAPGTPLIGTLKIESAGFGPIDILIGGGQGDHILVPNLPTSDPHNDGQLYSVGYVSGVTPGTVMVSAG